MQSNQTTRETILQVYVHPNLKYWSFALYGQLANQIILPLENISVRTNV